MVNILFVGVVGVGGVGGYFGGLIARAFEKVPDVNINFLTKQNHVEIIRNHGVCVQTLSEGFYLQLYVFGSFYIIRFIVYPKNRF